MEKYGRNKDKLGGEMQLSNLMLELIDEPIYAVEPLYAAAYRGDVDAIKKLAKLKVDPNVQHPDSGYTALHVAVFKYKLDSVVALLSEFKETLILGRYDDISLTSPSYPILLSSSVISPLPIFPHSFHPLLSSPPSPFMLFNDHSSSN